VLIDDAQNLWRTEWAGRAGGGCRTRSHRLEESRSAVLGTKGHGVFHGDSRPGTELVPSIFVTRPWVVCQVCQAQAAKVVVAPSWEHLRIAGGQHGTVACVEARVRVTCGPSELFVGCAGTPYVRK